MSEDFDLVIDGHTGDRQYWSDLWRYRELFCFLAWRDILVRYKQTAIGVAWSILRPLLTTVVFTIVFGRLAQFPSEGAPYPVLVFAALLPWQLFAGALSDSGQSLVSNAGLLSKVYFPRLLVPASAIAGSFVDFLISLVILLGLMVWYGFAPDWRILALPAFLLLALVIAFAFGTLFSALNVHYRDVRYVIPFLVQVGLYISPVGFRSSVVPENWRLLYSLNPMVGVIDGFRWAILGGESTLHPMGFALSVALSFILLTVAIVYFRRTERTFADVI